jgi:hypothetical protein
MIAINFADQSRLYQHDPIFFHMTITPLRVDPRFVTKNTGLKVPAEYDCATVFKSDRIWMEPEMIRILGYDYSQTDSLLYDYYNSVPSYWHACNNLQSLIRSGKKWFTPAYPIVDEEYIELVALYQIAMKDKGTFSLVEIGTRWDHGRSDPPLSSRTMRECTRSISYSWNQSCEAALPFAK